ncbi:MAG: hypothetical protein ACI8ZB_005330 [Desulforhopalus sp.]|jgi:hypothetical protein
MNYHYLIGVFLILLNGCQPKVYLMPPPVSLTEDSEFFDFTKDNKDDNLLYTIYATNRLPFERPGGSVGYTIFPSDTLRLGLVVHSVGEEGTSWEELHRLSLSHEREKKLLLRQIYARERTEYDDDDDITKISSSGEGFFDAINRALDRAFDKDLLIYVHGANSNFYRATAQGAQLYHYTGHNSVVLSFSWPSAENLFKYKTDVLHAKKTVPAFAKLIALLAAHTKARNINILAYSAGTQVVVPGLAYLRQQYADEDTEVLKERLRLGEVYFAAPDMDFDAFCEQYLQFRDIVYRTTINLNQNDSVLRLAAYQNGVSRLGRPNRNDITDEEEQMLVEALRTPFFDVLNVGDSKALNIGGSHSSWYSHPWVSNDLLLLLLFHGTPEERGLLGDLYDNGAQYYYFPDDYEQRIQEIIEEGRDESIKKKAALNIQ